VGLPAAVAAAQVEAVFIQQVPVFREGFFGGHANGAVVQARFSQERGCACLILFQAATASALLALLHHSKPMEVM